MGYACGWSRATNTSNMPWAGPSTRCEATRPCDGIGNWSVVPSPSAGITTVIPARAPRQPQSRGLRSEKPKPHMFPLQQREWGKKNQRANTGATTGVLASGSALGARLAGTLDHAAALLERVVATAPTSCLTDPVSVA